MCSRQESSTQRRTRLGRHPDTWTSPAHSHQVHTEIAGRALSPHAAVTALLIQGRAWLELKSIRRFVGESTDTVRTKRAGNVNPGSVLRGTMGQISPGGPKATGGAPGSPSWWGGHPDHSSGGAGGLWGPSQPNLLQFHGSKIFKALSRPTMLWFYNSALTWKTA